MTCQGPHPAHSDAANPRRNPTSRAASLVGLLLIGVGALQPAASQTEAVSNKTLAETEKAASLPLAMQSATAADVLHVTVGQSVVLTSAVPLRRVYVGNPAVLQTYTSGSTEVVLTAKAAGVSSMVLWGDAGRSQARRSEERRVGKE